MLLKRYIFKVYQHIMLERCDDDGTMFYFSFADFPGLHAEPYPFVAAAGHKMQGWIYSYDNPISGRLVIFEHGLGGGHRAYMKEIEMLCRHGYRVFAYDHTGCMDSGGESTNGFAQALCDLNDCVVAIKSDMRFKGVDLSVIGHSWGGYSTMNIVALHPDISHIVAMCGFVSVKTLLNSYAGRFLGKYSKFLHDYERILNPDFVDCDAVESLGNTDAKVLLIYSDNDEKSKPVHYETLNASLGEKRNIRFMMVHNKGHNPTYTEHAVELLNVFAKKRRKRKKWKRLETMKQKNEFVKSFDWNQMTMQDEIVWNDIFDSLNS